MKQAKQSFALAMCLCLLLSGCRVPAEVPEETGPSAETAATESVLPENTAGAPEGVIGALEMPEPDPAQEAPLPTEPAPVPPEPAPTEAPATEPSAPLLSENETPPLPMP